jgi:hypothetical protein
MARKTRHSRQSDARDDTRAGRSRQLPGALRPAPRAVDMGTGDQDMALKMARSSSVNHRPMCTTGRRLMCTTYS